MPWGTAQGADLAGVMRAPAGTGIAAAATARAAVARSLERGGAAREAGVASVGRCRDADVTLLRARAADLLL